MTTGVYATPSLSAGPFKALTFSQSSPNVGDTVTLTVQAQISNQITPGDTGSLQLMLPAGLFYVGSASLSCTVGGASSTCSATTASTLIGLQYTTITVTMDCSTQSCISGVTKTITVS